MCHILLLIGLFVKNIIAIFIRRNNEKRGRILAIIQVEKRLKRVYC